jgi:hypothetical protein
LVTGRFVFETRDVHRWHAWWEFGFVSRTISSSAAARR